eukprot:TRINITY_DN10380_c0_g1_i1.p1 TRINITY_DN10380_c0_g1~~TRINITY_DN10380_c0_g1_i1.p1  ORF type:complete len:495 (+),score=93.26 TRINITY_DN10380_c0_g1_i1:69-1553(+)
MFKVHTTILVVALLSVCFSATLPGVRVTISQVGLEFANKIGAEILQKLIATTTIPDVNGVTDVPIVGKVDYYLTSIKLTNAQFGKTTVVATPGKGIAVSIADITGHMTCDWRYHEENWPHVGDHGTADIDISGSAMDMLIVLSYQNGEPNVEASGVQVFFEGFKIDLHGGAGWLYDLLVKLFSGDIKRDLDSIIAETVTKAINVNLNQLLDTVPMKQHLANWGLLDYSLINAPVVTSGFVTFDAIGMVVDLNNPVPPPFSNTINLPQSVNSSAMIQLFFSDFVTTSGVYTAYKQGLLNKNITDSVLPSNFPIRFNTSSFQFMIPQLYAKYPNMMMLAQLIPGYSPQFTVNKTGLSLGAMYDAYFYVLPPGQNPIPTFTLSSEFNISGSAQLQGLLLTGEINAVDFELELVSSQIGQFDPKSLNTIANIAIKSLLVPELNAYFKQGLKIPVTGGVTLLNPQITYNDHYLSVISDLEYSTKNFYVQKPHNKLFKGF